MNKFKIFNGSDLQKIEDEMNNFIENKRLIDIKMSTNYIGEGYVDPTEYVYVVIYEEVK